MGFVTQFICFYVIIYVNIKRIVYQTLCACFFMCISPNSIKNPNFGLHHLKGVDTVHQMLRVPCGHCSECIHVKQMGYVQRVIMESQHHHLFFCTLTYSNDMMPSLTTSTGFQIRYVDIRDVQTMLKRLRQKNVFGRPFRYFGVSERGSKKGRPHVHLLFSVEKLPDDDYLTLLDMETSCFKKVLSNWCRNISSDKKPVYVPLCKYKRIYTRNGVRSNYDFHYVRPDATEEGVSDVGFYVLKYMLKPSDKEVRLQQALHLNLSEDEYERIWSVVRSRCFMSKHFGDDIFINRKWAKDIPVTFDVEAYVRRSIRSSYGQLFPMFFNPINGNSLPLSRFYRKRFFLFSDIGNFPDVNSSPEREDDSYSQLLTKFQKHEKIKNLQRNSDLFDEVEFD